MAGKHTLGVWAARVALMLVVGAYALFIWSRFAPAISTPDSNGYWAQGSLLAATGKTWFVPEAQTQYVGMHWLITPSGEYISRYPPGVPAIVAAVYWLAGYKASVWVGPVMAILTLPGLYLLMRRFVTSWWAIGGVLLLMSLPIYAHHAIASESHMGVTFCLVWGTCLLLCWAGWPVVTDTGAAQQASQPSAMGRVTLAFFAGLVLGMIPTIRYPDAVMGAGIAVFALWQVRRYRRIWVDYTALALGAAIPIVALLAHNQLLLGAFWRTGYSLTNEQTGFSWGYFTSHFFPYIQTIQGEGLGLIFALGIVGIVWLCAMPRTRAIGLMLALQALLMIGLYMAYYWAPQGNGTMRFLLPLFPGFALAAVWMLSSATAQAPRLAKVAVPAVIIGVQLLWGGYSAWNETQMLHHQQDVLARVTDALEETAAHGDVVIANDQIQQQLDFVRHWKLVDGTAARQPGFLGRMVTRMRDETAPSPMQAQKQRERMSRYAGMTDSQREAAISADIMQWAGDHAIYYVGSAAEMQQAIALLGGGGKGSFKIVKRLELPPAPQLPTGGGPFGGGRGGRGGFAGMPGAGGPPPMGGPGAPGGAMPPGPGAPGGPPPDGPGGPGGGGMGGFFGGGGGGGGRFGMGGLGPRGGGGGGMFGPGLQGEAVIARWIPAATAAVQSK